MNHPHRLIVMISGFTLAAASAACGGTDEGDPTPPSGSASTGGGGTGGDGGTGGGGGDGGSGTGGAPPACEDVECDDPPPAECSEGVLTSYAASGTCEGDICSYPVAEEIACPLGCCGDHCCGFEPSNGGDVGSLEPTGLSIVAPPGVFDTSAGCVSPSVLGDCSPVDDAGAAPLCVCRVDSLTVGSMTVVGQRALAILAYDSVNITGSLDVGGVGASAGPGAFATYAFTSDTARGGSFGTLGGNAGAEPIFGTPELVPLLGGMTGQSSTCGAPGGGAGGALQVSALGQITVTGSIRAGGGGGSFGYSPCLAGAGGGSGGAILLEAPVVTLLGSLSANGGGGGGGSSTDFGAGFSGQDGPTGAGAAFGGSGEDDHGCALYGYTVGGDGGSGSAASSAGGWGQSGDSISGCIGGTESVGAGGGGGGAGRIRINTVGGCQCSGEIAGATTFGTIVPR